MIKCWAKAFSKLDFKHIEANFKKLNHFEMLGVKPNSEYKAIKSNFVRLVKHFHPDKYEGSPEVFRKVKTSWSVLRDKQKRSSFRKFHSNQKDFKRGESNPEFEEAFKAINMEREKNILFGKKTRLRGERLVMYKNILHRRLTEKEYLTSKLLSNVAEESNRLIKPREPEQREKRDYDQLLTEEIGKLRFKKVYKRRKEVKEEKEKISKEEKSKALADVIGKTMIFYSVVIGIILFRAISDRMKKEAKIREIEEKERKKKIKYQYI